MRRRLGEARKPPKQTSGASNSLAFCTALEYLEIWTWGERGSGDARVMRVILGWQLGESGSLCVGSLLLTGDVEPRRADH